MKKMRLIGWYAVILLLVMACKTDDDSSDGPDNLSGCNSSMPIGADYDLDIPFYVSLPTNVPSDNPMKVAAVELGRYLFWEKKLSGDNSMSCGTCHSPTSAFSDPMATSVGIDGISGNRNSMPLVNMVLSPNFFWDGRAETLEEQVVQPVEDPIEMHESWDNAIMELEEDTLYAQLFEATYGTDCIDRCRSAKAIAQFLRSMTSFNSKYDRAVHGPEILTPLEQLGLNIWSLEGGTSAGQEGADCFHCHALDTEIFTDFQFRNNGLDSVFSDLGRGEVTGLPGDYAKFKTPSLRNIEYSAPYMHDGRFETLEEVVEHYNSGGVASNTVDPNMEFIGGGLELTSEKKAAVVAFLKTFSDEEFINNPAFSDPH